MSHYDEQEEREAAPRVIEARTAFMLSEQGRQQHKWDVRMLEMATMVASWSKDKSRKTGCIITGPNREIRSTGYNGFPRGVVDSTPARHVRPAKYLWTEHAERNAIYNAARCGTPLDGCTIYLPWYPCAECARAIIQCGITTVVGVEPDWNDPKYAEDFKVVVRMLAEARVIQRFVEGFTAPAQQPVEQS